MEAEIKHIEDKKLANGVIVRVFDKSRRVAGDRWQVRVSFNAVITIPESLWASVSVDDDLLAEIRATLGSSLIFTDLKERNFIAEDEKENLITEIIDSARKNIFTYLASPTFPELYFNKCFKETREKVERKRQAMLADKNAEEIEEPVDFSHIFKD